MSQRHHLHARLTHAGPSVALTSRPNLPSVKRLRGSGGRRRSAPPLFRFHPGSPHWRVRGAGAEACARPGRLHCARALAVPRGARLRRARRRQAGGARGGPGAARREAPRQPPEISAGRRSSPLGRSSAPPPREDQRRQVGRERAGARSGWAGARVSEGRLEVPAGPRGGAGGTRRPAAAATGRRCRRLQEASLGRHRRRAGAARCTRGMWALVSVPHGPFHFRMPGRAGCGTKWGPGGGALRPQP